MKKIKIAAAILVLLITVVNIACKKPGVQVQTPPSQPPPPPPPPHQQRWMVTTVAGVGTRAFADGPALSARFAFPADVAVSADGTLYITDILNARIRRITAGQVFTFAGNGVFDIVNGEGSFAKFINPFSITIDGFGNLYTSDENDPRIRKITPASFVTLYAGKQASGFVNGNADTARFGFGDYLVADQAGNLYLSDVRNNAIRKITTDGKVSTIAGTGVAGFRDGEGSQAQFNFPGGIAIDEQSNLYVADRGNYRIRKISPAGIVSTVTGIGTPGNTDGNATQSQFSIDMHDMVIDEDGNLYLEDENRIRKITPQGVVSTIAGSTAGYMDGEGISARFDYPNGLAIDANGNLYVADLNNNRIRKISFE